MKDGLENIDKIVKQAFDGFEANVDPSVWGNIQSSIASSAGSIPGATSVVGKSLALKIVAGVIAVSSISTGAYFILNDTENTESHINIANSNVVVENTNVENQEVKTTEKVKTVAFITKNEQRAVEENIVKEKIAEEAISSENINLNEAAPIFDNSSNEEEENTHREEEPTKKPIKVEEPAKKVLKKAVNEKVTANKSSKEQEFFGGTIQASLTLGTAPLDVDFEVEGENIVSYSWDFGDNSEIAKEESVFHTFEEPGNYMVKLIILDKNAKSKTLIKHIEVESRTKASLGVIQDAFTPTNGDGNNDVFKLKATRNISIFNAKVMHVANGEVIFEWNSIEQGWDGTDLSGRKLPPGTYSLSIRAVGVDGEFLQKDKMITLY